MCFSIILYKHSTIFIDIGVLSHTGRKVLDPPRPEQLSINIRVIYLGEIEMLAFL